MALKKSPSHRKGWKYAKINRKKAKAAIKRAQKNKTHRIKKDPGIPNLYPFKKQLLQKIIARKQNPLQTTKLSSQTKKQTNFPSEQTEKNSMPPQNRKYKALLSQVSSLADILLFVIDARDPLGSRNADFEFQFLQQKATVLSGNKKVILVLNKIDLVPSNINQAWLQYLQRNFDLPVVAFRSSTTKAKKLGVSATKGKNAKDKELANSHLCVGATTLISLLKSITQSESLNPTKATVTVGVAGLPNVGKSSVINSLKRRKIASTSPVPGHTRAIQEISLDKKIVLLDSPGVIFGDRKQSSLVLKNCVRVEKIESPQDTVHKILERCDKENLCALLEISPFKDTETFLAAIAFKRGFLLKGGRPNVDTAARVIIREWNSGEIPFYFTPPAVHEKQITSSIDNNGVSLEESAKIVDGWKEKLDLGKLNGKSVVQCEMDGNLCDENGGYVEMRK